MKKNILLKLLLITPILFIVISFIICLSCHEFNNNMFNIIIGIYGLLCLTVFFPNILYAFFLPKNKYKLRDLLYWNMIIKVSNLPIYLIILIGGNILIVNNINILSIPFLIVTNYLLLLPSSMYGINCLLTLYENKIISKKVVIFKTICYFILFIDIICALSLYFKYRNYKEI